LKSNFDYVMKMFALENLNRSYDNAMKKLLAQEAAADPQPSTFRPVFVQAHHEAKITGTALQEEMLTRAEGTTETDHPRLWRVLEHAVAHKYELVTGNSIPVYGFDWSTLLQWIETNWSSLLPIITSLVAIFA
jgi:hypothetical protein